MPLTTEHRFLFDTAGFLHLRAALPTADLARYQAWAEDLLSVNVQELNRADPSLMTNQMNRPVSRIIDADVRFAELLDHPAVAPYLREFLGTDYRHIDNELLHTVPGYAGGRWHRGVKPHPTGHVVDGRFICPMVKVFYCLTDVKPGGGEFVVVPGSHKSNFDCTSADPSYFPGQYVFDNVAAGDVILFNEALMHNGRPNASQVLRKTLVVNFGRETAGTWSGYRCSDDTLQKVTPAQRAILSNRDRVWSEPNLMAEAFVGT